MQRGQLMISIEILSLLRATERPREKNSKHQINTQNEIPICTDYGLVKIKLLRRNGHFILSNVVCGVWCVDLVPIAIEITTAQTKSLNTRIPTASMQPPPP